MFGILNLHKPAGMTSRDVVNRVQRLVKPHKVGHAGTLDPLATGVLVVCLGSATRLIEYVQRMPKRYLGTFLFGRHSDTEDIEGNVTELSNSPIPTEAQIREVLTHFVGRIEQMPPAFSALKVEGQRAYALARRGEAVELKPRTIEVHSIDLARYDYPTMELDVRCGSGTYIRSLGRDIARELGTEAVMSALVRMEIGPFHLDSALDGNDITPQSIDRSLLSPRTALGNLPTITVTPDDEAYLRNGRAIATSVPTSGTEQSPEFAAINPSGRLVAILAPQSERELRPVIVFP